ncbi:bifunctional E2/E3 enzyme R795-like isoform 3 [Solea senegalensis]|uniref:Bifunctional E2/E3 enzyme R795-like isoform 3 n=1 Tax=Solea senegalensis TaxID=28829 RepID=A0AAV6PDN7_SOLSE|nr:bifunctional E2/E3 enzyme R795-like isoform 3 [Solea senegalensis]
MAAATISVQQEDFCCSVCLDVLSDPVTIPCGHSYCLGCIQDHWNGVQHSCPQCRQVFNPRPVLKRNTVLAELVEKFKKSQDAAQHFTKPVEVKCSVCKGVKCKAVKSCCACSESYCVSHLKVHEKRFHGKAHKLIPALHELREKLCPQSPDTVSVAAVGTTQNMDALFKLLSQYRLGSYHTPFLQIGVSDEQDFLDSVTDEDLQNLGLSQVEKNRFMAMKSFIQTRGAPDSQVQKGTSVQKSLEVFTLQYTYPKCPQPKHIKGIDPAQDTVEDLMSRICHLENVGRSKGVCLYTIDGMPLTEDPFFNTWSLKDRHIENGAMIYAIFTPKENLREAPQIPHQQFVESSGEDLIRCHIMLKGDFEVMVNLQSDTLIILKHKLAAASGIPAHVLHYIGPNNESALQSCGITEGSTLAFSLYTTNDDEWVYKENFYIDDIVPSVQQTRKGISVFLSSIYAVKRGFSGIIHNKLIAYIRQLTGCSPLAQGLHQLIYRNGKITRNQKISVVEGLYVLFRELLPELGSRRGERVVKDVHVFENSLCCWAHLISKAKKRSTEFENYAPVTLVPVDGDRYCEPVRVPGLPTVFERAYVLQKIKGGEKIPNCTEKFLQEESLVRAIDIEKILLSLPPSIKIYHLWIYQEKISQNFQLNMQKTFGKMVEGLKTFPVLNVTPPLHLKGLGFDYVGLVLLSDDNLGVYLGKNKGSPDVIIVHDCLDGKEKTVDVNVLAAMTGDQRADGSFITSRTPKEAILVLIDTSSSMEEECYGNAGIKKINAVKELFDNFASRSMAYDFHHVIGLVKFDAMVKTLHTFTENLEKFKVHIRNLEPNGCTLLYDALRRGLLELQKVKEKFPDCRLRIMCLTDGIDSGSSIEPVAITEKLLNSNIVVDSILLGNVENNMLHGISNATGGCCFKPQTTKEGLKLFEVETVLSLEQRKPKKKLDASSLSERILTGIFSTHGYDEYPETSLPNQLKTKVIGTESALKKKLRESKDKRLMEKDRRILEELKSLHCDPHPFFRVFTSESDFTFWRILMQGPPDTPYEKGAFELYCQFGPDYPVKPPLFRFVTQVYHCNVNSVGRICHSIFDRSYNANITMKEIFDAVYGLLIVPEPDDPLDSILAEEFLTNREMYELEAKRHTQQTAGNSLDDMEKTLVDHVPQFIPQHLMCPLTKKMFVDPVKTVYGTVYERKAIEEHLKLHLYDPMAGPGHDLDLTYVTTDWDMKKMVKDHRSPSRVVRRRLTEHSPVCRLKWKKQESAGEFK